MQEDSTIWVGMDVHNPLSAHRRGDISPHPGSDRPSIDGLCTTPAPQCTSKARG